MTANTGGVQGVRDETVFQIYPKLILIFYQIYIRYLTPCTPYDVISCLFPHWIYAAKPENYKLAGLRLEWHYLLSR